MSRAVSLVILAEDQFSAGFLKSVFVQVGCDGRSIRVDYRTSGCGSQRVRQQFPAEVGQARSRGSRLAVHTDADSLTVPDRAATLARALADAGVPARADGDRITLAIPKWCTEAWVAYLRGQPADETRQHWPDSLHAQCRTAARRLARLLRGDELWPDDAPASLVLARGEFQRLL